MDKKFELTGESRMGRLGVMVHQIRATEGIPARGIRKGDVGGWVESEILSNGNARVSGDAWVSGNAEVSGNAWVSGDAELEHAWHYIAIGPIGSEGVTATLTRTKDGKHILGVGCWTGTLGTLMKEVKRRRRHWIADEETQDLWLAQYKALKALGAATAARWGDV